MKYKTICEIKQEPVKTSYVALIFSGEGETKTESIRRMIAKIESYFGISKQAKNDASMAEPDIMPRNCTRCKHSTDFATASWLNLLYCKNVESKYCLEVVDSTNTCLLWGGIEDKK